MPKVFLVRNRRQQHWKKSAEELVTPPPSPEQTSICAPTKQVDTHHPSLSGKII